MITFTITTCKRLELFKKTMDSFLTYCKDQHLISRWICVDDNSSTDDREKMKRLYPFFEFHFKSRGQKGHARSMNMLRSLVKSEYIFHMEDDWEFCKEGNYITECLQGFQVAPNVGQVLINRNYAETLQDLDLVGGKEVKVGERTYILHEHYEEGTDEYHEFWDQNTGISNVYWPHYSLRPSLLKRQVWDQIGAYSETHPNFEMEYGHRYKQHYVSVFLPDIYCLHIGKNIRNANSEEKNAYELNNEVRNIYVTLSITTCKRLPLFRHTIASFWHYCKDKEYLTQFICVDDNSTEADREEMKMMVPFFTFIWKGEEDKGHPRSMNILWPRVENEYLLHLEDDWLFSEEFYIKDLLSSLQHSGASQILMVPRPGDEKKIMINDRFGYYEYKYNPHHSWKPDNYRQYDREHGNEYSYNSSDGWWWPGFSLNPSLIKFTDFKDMKFDEGNHELFEYDYAARAHERNLNIITCSMGVTHIGSQSAYVLNDMKRSWD